MLTLFPVEMTPMNNISAPTYRDGMTYTRGLEEIKDWLNKTLVPGVNNGIGTAIEELQEGITGLEDAYIENQETLEALITAALNTVNQIVAGIANNPEINVVEFGAIGDNATDNLAAFQAAYAESLTKNGATIYIPDGDYRLSAPWDIYRSNSPAKPMTIRGESQQNTRLIANFYGAEKALISVVDTNRTSRASATSFVNLQFANVSTTLGTNPVFIDVYGHGESRLQGVRFGSSNNTHYRGASLQNVRMDDVVSFYGGKNFLYRDTTGVTFTSVEGSPTLTASADIFNAADVGRVINVYGTDTRVKYSISNYTDPTHVSISGNTPAIDMTNASGYFENARVTTTAGSAMVSANAQCFTAADVGRVIYIQGVRNGAHGPALLRATITGLISPATVELDRPADISVVRAEFSTAVMEVYSESGGAGAGTNDVKINNLHIENYAGVGLIAQNTVFFHMNDFKVHGEVTPIPTRASDGQLWFDDFAGKISGEFDGMSMGQARFHLCNMNDLLTVDWLATRLNINEKVFEVNAMTDPGGVIEVRTINTYRPTLTGDPYELIKDDPDGKLVFKGLVNMLGDTVPPRIYSGKGTYFTLAGEMVTKSPDGSRYKINVANGGAISTTLVT